MSSLPVSEWVFLVDLPDTDTTTARAASRYRSATADWVACPTPVSLVETSVPHRCRVAALSTRIGHAACLVKFSWAHACSFLPD